MIGTALALTILEKSFERWAEKQGAEVIGAVASNIGTWSWKSVLHLGPKRAAKSEFKGRFKSESELLTVKLQQEQTDYNSLPGRLYEAKGLKGDKFHNFVLVPRAIVNANAMSQLREQLGNAALLADVDTEYFFENLVAEFDKSLFDKMHPYLKDPALSYKGLGSSVYIIAKGTDSKWARAHSFQVKYPGYYMALRTPFRSDQILGRYQAAFTDWQGEIAGWTQDQWNEASGFSG